MKMICFSGSGIPLELEEQILLKLPVKSLLRFKSICKSWNSLISDPEFVKDHLEANTHKSNTAFSNNKPSSLVLAFVRGDPPVFLDEDGNDLQLDQKQMLSLVSSPTTVDNIDLPLRPKVFGDGNGFLMPLRVSHCNGILCLVDLSPYFETRFVFYNPALGEHEFLQTSSPKDRQYRYTRESYGFGHDPKTDDYKFISIVEHAILAEPTIAEVYSLRTGVWREIKLKLPCSLSLVRAYVKGRYYWINLTDVNILSFDMSDESFESVEFPRREVHVRGWYPRVFAWGESLAYVATYNGGMSSPPRYYDMWVMDRHDSSWAKHFMIGELVGPLRPVAFWKGDEVLMEDSEGRFFSYNLHSKEQRKLPIPLHVKSRTAHFCLYVESLVSVKRNYHLDLELHLGWS